MKTNMPKILLLSLSAGMTFAQPVHCQDIYYDNVHTRVIHARADLPTGGEFVPNPKNKSEVYYFTNRARMWNCNTNVQKRPGLYRSTDEGQTWSLICYFFEFKNLFIHPDTGRLFAIIEDTSLAEHEGFLMSHMADKAISSSDGKHWIDIMGKQKSIGRLYGIFRDPDYPDRVCLTSHTLRGYVLQSKDANYSDWESIHAWEWNKKHPNK